MGKIRTIRSGGQTGADRAALDAARSVGVPITGWCPLGGLAEDCPCPPGLLLQYPELTETPTNDYYERTAWNVRDSDATLIMFPHELKASVGTEYTIKIAHEYGRPCLVLDHVDVAKAIEWLDSLGDNLDLNVAGPRLSNFLDVYNMTHTLVHEVLMHFAVFEDSCDTGVSCEIGVFSDPNAS